MIGSGNRLWRALRAISLSGLALFYLFAATRLAFPLKEWMETDRDRGAVQAQAFPCAIHKCQCKNALQCGAHCCCFPKKTGSHAPDRGDLLAAHLTACGGEGADGGELPSLSEHLPIPPDADPVPAQTGPWVPAVIPLHPSPDPESLFKVPIPRFA